MGPMQITILHAQHGINEDEISALPSVRVEEVLEPVNLSEDDL